VYPGRVAPSRGAPSIPGVVLAVLLLWIAVPRTASGQEPSRPAASRQEPEDVTELDLDDLIQVRVTGAGRKEQRLSDVPAAIYILRGEDLRRMGTTTLAEALRAVPGVHVGRTKASSWAVCPRGFSDVLSNKLLVLVDGRSVYSPLHSGVYWDVQDTYLEDVERIEVIRGPGGSLWGANAVNGIVNVITKPGTATDGFVVTAGGGTEERAFGTARYGFKAAEDLYVRVYSKYFQVDDARDGVDPRHRAYDGWSMARGGFRADWRAGEEDRLSFMADYYDGQVKEHVVIPLLTAPFSETIRKRGDVRGADAVFRWEHTSSPSSGFIVQSYYDYTRRNHAVFTDVLHTADVDFQHRFSPMDGQDVLWGVGYRIYRSVMEGTLVLETRPKGHTDDVVSAFIQDELTLIPKHLRLTVGSKFEHNDYSGFEYQPSGRFAWSPEESHLLWGAVSRAVRTPSIIDADGRITPLEFGGAPPIALSIVGNDEFRSEHLLAYEAGYRVRPVDPLSLDLAVFYNRYDRVRSGTVGTLFVDTQPPPTHFVVPVDLKNAQQGQTRGVELAASFQAAPWWLLQVNYTYLHLNMNASDVNHRSPHHQVWARSAMDLPGNLTLDVTGRFVDKLPEFDVPSYVEVDVRLAWRDESRRIEAAVVGQNLVHATHPEFEAASKRSEFQRGAYASLTVRF
jgi:iron complex outermembrane recepter protein